jgi:hypothetical protein
MDWAGQNEGLRKFKARRETSRPLRISFRRALPRCIAKFDSSWEPSVKYCSCSDKTILRP